MSDPRPGAAPHRPPGPEPAPAAGRIDVAFTFGPISVTIVAQDPTAAVVMMPFSIRIDSRALTRAAISSEVRTWSLMLLLRWPRRG